VWVAPVRKGRRSGAPQRLARGSNSLAWSPDARRIAYIATVEGETDVWVTPVDASEAPERVTRGADVSDVRWLATGRGLLVLGLWGRRNPEIRSVDPTTLEVTPVPHAEPSDPFSHVESFDVTPDGRWLILLEESHRGDVWVLDAQDGTF
jgi:dipeptidyl aminopeptidase/acylaminoacyl peptidase